jgi:hypothetical protein
MSSNITVLNSDKTEFDFSNINIKTHYNIILHCVYDPFGDFDNEFAFLLDPKHDENTLIILWHPVEQGVFEPEWMAKLDAIVERSPFRLVYLTGCSHKLNVHTVSPHKFDLRFLPIFDIRSNDIWNLTGGAKDISTHKSQKFMFINSKDAPNRRYILGKLLEHGLIGDGIVSYRCQEGYFTNGFDFEQVRGFSAEFLEDAHRIFDSCLPRLPIKIDDGGNANSLPRSLFLDSYINIVGETQFVNIPHGYNKTFVTEKTFNAIANNQMFIIVGQAHSLDLLKSLGYKTFDGIIDETYDTLLNNQQRLEAVSAEVIRFINRPMEQVHEDYVKVLDVIEHNRNLLFSNNSLEQRLQEFVDSL